MSSSPNTTQKILIRCGRHGWAVATLTLRPNPKPQAENG
jgi:hypothetical protein